jgi:ADP-ribose pyrophosphatase
MQMSQDQEKSPGASPFRLLSSKGVYQNPWMSVREDRVIRPDGAEGIFGVVTMKAGSSVLAVDDDLQVFLTREYCYALQRESLEAVSGAMEGQEQPLAAAKRELAEEIGLVAREWIDLGWIDPFTTVISSPNYMFLALGLTPTPRKLDAGEVLDVVKMPFAEALDLVMAGKITHGASCVLILKAQALLKARGMKSS